MERSVQGSVRELVQWLKQHGWSGYRRLVCLGRQARLRYAAQVTAQRLPSNLGAFFRANRAATHGRRHGQRPVPLRLALTLGLPVVTTLLLMHVASDVQVARASGGCNWYRVQPGDTLSAIGARYGVSVQTLAATNQIPNPDLILVGQRLCIPTSDATPGGGDTPSPQPGPVSGAPAFVGLALPYAQRAHQQNGWPVSLILAQWGLEQGWKAPGYTGYNWGNVAALPGEPTVGGIQAWGSPAAFAYAKTPEDGLRYYLRVSALAYYAAVAPAATSGGVDAAARALGRSPWDAGHYTNHGDPGSSLINILRTYNLYQYDHSYSR